MNAQIDMMSGERVHIYDLPELDKNNILHKFNIEDIATNLGWDLPSTDNYTVASSATMLGIQFSYKNPQKYLF